MDINDLINSQLSYAAYFSILLFYVLKTTHRREERYQEIIKKLTEEITQDLRELKNILNQ